MEKRAVPSQEPLPSREQLRRGRSRDSRPTPPPPLCLGSRIRVSPSPAHRPVPLPSPTLLQTGAVCAGGVSVSIRRIIGSREQSPLSPPPTRQHAPSPRARPQPRGPRRHRLSSRPAHGSCTCPLRACQCSETLTRGPGQDSKNSQVRKGGHSD